MLSVPSTCMGRPCSASPAAICSCSCSSVAASRLISVVVPSAAVTVVVSPRDMVAPWEVPDTTMGEEMSLEAVATVGVPTIGELTVRVWWVAPVRAPE